MTRRPWWIVLIVLLAACQQAGGHPSLTTPVATASAEAGQTQAKAAATATNDPPKLAALAAATLARPAATSTLAPTTPALISLASPAPAGSNAEHTTPVAPAAIAPPLPNLATPTPLPDDWSYSAHCYYQPCQVDLVSPDQKHHWPQTCRSLGLDTECQISFPDGQKSATYRLFWSLKWSPTNDHLLVPLGGSHSSPPGGYEVWDMLTPRRVAALSIAYTQVGWAQWATEGLSVFYLKRNSTSTPEMDGVTVFDVATGAESITRQCPTQVANNLQSGDDYRFWRQLCDNVAPPPSKPVILSFTVEPTAVYPGQSVTLQWTTSGGAKATLQQNASGTFLDEIDVPLNGSTSVFIEQSQRAWSSFSLRLTDNSSQADWLDARLTILCPDAFFFTEAPPPSSAGCPYRPAAWVDAAEQPFEHGRMIWLDAIPAASSRSGAGQAAAIYVFYDTGVVDNWQVWQMYDDAWTEGEPESDPSLVAPAGLHQPIRGFGKVWRTYPQVREKLGWALEAERGLDGAYQIGTDYYANAGDVYLCTQHGDILKLRLDEDSERSGHWDVWMP